MTVPARTPNWVAVSGQWDDYILDNGNKVLRQSLRFDRKRSVAPNPYLLYRTIRLHPDRIAEVKADEASFDFGVLDFYASFGEMAVFFGGESEQDLYAFIIGFNGDAVTEVTFTSFSMKSRDLSERHYGNYVEQIWVEKQTDIPLSTSNRIRVKKSATGMSLSFNDRPLLELPARKYKAYAYRAKSYFAVGSRGVNGWIDNILLKSGKRVYIFEDFTKPSIRRYRLIVKDKSMMDNLIPTSPR